MSQYEVSVRGDLPSDLNQKISAAHAKALQAQVANSSDSGTAIIDSERERSPDAYLPVSVEGRPEF